VTKGHRVRLTPEAALLWPDIAGKMGTIADDNFLLSYPDEPVVVDWSSMRTWLPRKYLTDGSDAV
jgi:hypothetical protein